MFSSEWLSMLLQFLILVPGALSCYLPLKNCMRFSEGKTFALLDMAAIFGNIMENAISACAALPEGDRYFNLTAEMRHGNTLYVVSTNSFDGKVRRGKDGYYSTKHSGRGTGLISIAAVAEKYCGSAQFRNSDSEFFVDVVMKI